MNFTHHAPAWWALHQFSLKMCSPQQRVHFSCIPRYSKAPLCSVQTETSSCGEFPSYHCMYSYFSNCIYCTYQYWKQSKKKINSSLTAYSQSFTKVFVQQQVGNIFPVSWPQRIDYNSKSPERRHVFGGLPSGKRKMAHGYLILPTKKVIFQSKLLVAQLSSTQSICYVQLLSFSWCLAEEDVFMDSPQNSRNRLW